MNKKNSEFTKYIFASALVYVILFTLLYLLIDLLQFNKSLGFFIAYLIAYPIAYLMQLYIFQKSKKKENVIRFIFHIAFFFLLSNLSFNLLIYLKIHHFLATIITIFITFPLRFLSSKLIVFRN